MIRVGSADDHGLDLSVIHIDGGTQSRASLYQNVVDEYANAMRDGAEFPAIVVFYDGKKHWLADGFHRFHAYQKIGRAKVAADVRQGTRRDAILHSVGANESHGLRRTNEDKRRAVLTLLNDEEWAAWSDREIARRCAVHHELVGKLRPVTGGTASERTYTTKHGSVATMQTAAIGSKAPVRAFDPQQAREHIEAAKVIRAERQSDKAGARDEKEAALAEKMRAAAESLGQGRFGVIYADPPWRFEPYSRDTGMDRAADNHYPTMDLEAIAALDVPAADDCVLFLWATAPMLPQALDVMSAWGFAYKSHTIWVKDRIGTGYWFRNKHEILLIGTKGNIPAPAPGTQPESVIVAPVGAHSAKPEVFAELIERLFPNLPKIEMFARTSRPGWHGWGAEAESSDGEGAIEPAGSEHLGVARNDADMEQGNVDRSATARTPAGEDSFALAGQIEPRTKAENLAGNASLAAREGEKSLHTSFQSDGDAFAEVKGKARPADAAGVEPPLSDTSQRPADSAGSDGDPSIPTDDARGAGQGVAAPAHDPQSTEAVTNSIPQPSSSQAADQTGAAPPPAAPVALNPQCRKPDTCKWARAQFSCSDCANAAMRAKQVAA